MTEGTPEAVWNGGMRTVPIWKQLAFLANKWIKFGMYVKFSYYITYAEPSRKTV
jgi:hypothetical protein